MCVRRQMFHSKFGPMESKDWTPLTVRPRRRMRTLLLVSEHHVMWGWESRLITFNYWYCVISFFPRVYDFSNSNKFHLTFIGCWRCISVKVIHIDEKFSFVAAWCLFSSVLYLCINQNPNKIWKCFYNQYKHVWYFFLSLYIYIFVSSDVCVTEPLFLLMLQSCLTGKKNNCNRWSLCNILMLFFCTLLLLYFCFCFGFCFEWTNEIMLLMLFRNRPHG